MYTLPAVGYITIQLLAVQGTVSLEFIILYAMPPCLPGAQQLVAYYNVELCVSTIWNTYIHVGISCHVTHTRECISNWIIFLNEY